MVQNYESFAWYVTRLRRHVLGKECQDFLAYVLETSTERSRRVEKSERFWRAQLGCDHEQPDFAKEYGPMIEVDPAVTPYGPERMKPLAFSSEEGRVNPKGIPCLYCCTNLETAIAEVRPWIGSHVSVGEVVLSKDLDLVDCSLEPTAELACEFSGMPKRREPELWRIINLAFSHPVIRTDNTADYAPTQVLAEKFSERYDGIIYSSRLGPGKNLALFNPDITTICNRSTHRIESVKFTTSPSSVVHS